MLVVAAFQLWLLPVPTLRFAFWVLSRLIYRVRVEGLEHVPAEGGALLVANRVSRLDELLLLAYCPRPVRIIADSQRLRGGAIGWLARRGNAILSAPDRPDSIEQAVHAAREAAAGGELVAILPEAGMTPSGNPKPFQPHVLSILKGAGIPLVPLRFSGFAGACLAIMEGGHLGSSGGSRVP